MEQSGEQAVVEDVVEGPEKPDEITPGPEPVIEPDSDEPLPTEVMSEEFFSAAVSESALNVIEVAEQELRSLLEAIVYITDEPLSAQQIATAIERPLDQVQKGLDKLVEQYEGAEHGLTIRELAGGYKMGTKPEHHEAMRTFVKKMKPPLKLSLAALETLAVIAYKQPATGPEIMEIRGVQGGGVMKTLLDRKLIASAGRKNVVGKPMMYKTTREFLLQFGLKDLSELPTLKEFEELKRLAFSDPEAEDGPSEVEGPATPEEAAATGDRTVVGEGNDRVPLDEVQANAEPEPEAPLPHRVPPKEDPPADDPEPAREEPPQEEPDAPREEPPQEEPPQEEPPKEGD
jgi:segregation and condensation protein B